MKISKRLKKNGAEFLLLAALAADFVWFHTGWVFWVAVLALILMYLNYRREARLDAAASEPVRQRMTTDHIRRLERQYTVREDFNTPEKRALLRSPLDRHYYHFRYERVQALVAQWTRACERRLDLGCGFGGNTLYMARLSPGTVVGLELDDLKLSEASTRARKLETPAHISFVCGDAMQPPLRAAGFDSILMTEVLEHVIDPPAALQACSDLLRDDGLLLLSTPSRHDLNYTCNPLVFLEKCLSLATDRLLPLFHNLHAQFEYNRRKPEPAYGMHYHFSHQKLERLLGQAGFQTLWRGSFEIEFFPFLLVEFFAQKRPDVIRAVVAPMEAALQKMPLVRHLGQHLLWVAKKRR